MRVFISRAEEDKFHFEAVKSRIKADSECDDISWWSAHDNLRFGQQLKSTIEQAVKRADACLFIATRQSVASQWCMAELGAFWATGKPVLTLVGDGVSVDDLPGLLKGTLAKHWDDAKAEQDSIGTALKQLIPAKPDLEDREKFVDAVAKRVETGMRHLLDLSPQHIEDSLTLIMLAAAGWSERCAEDGRAVELQKNVKFTIQERLQALAGERRSDLVKLATATVGHVEWLRDAEGGGGRVWLALSADSYRRRDASYPCVMLGFYLVDDLENDLDGTCIASAIGVLTKESSRRRFAKGARGLYQGREGCPLDLEVIDA
ncbi:MAG: toll/interleukin-1 receptor domain-containing protein [Myxococcales bacterium]|nr:toll/interleukin-1 receptor domain-containing protein [Myxococcales bacterium]